MSDWKMHRYAEHAQRDALSIFMLLDEIVGIDKAKDQFSKIPEKEVAEFVRVMSPLVTEFLALPDSKRASYIARSFQKSSDALTIFLVAATLGAMRVNRFHKLRHRFIDALEPGLAYRASTSMIYAFTVELQEIVDLEWPNDLWEAFNAVKEANNERNNS